MEYNLKKMINDKKTYWGALLLAIIVGVFVRTRNLIHLKGKYLLGLDPYIFYKYAGIILEKGKLMAVDMMRYAPEGYLLRPADKFFSYFMAYAYKVISWTGLTRMQWHIIYPVVATVFCLIFFFLFVKELFNIKVAAIATLLLAVLPAFIYRMGAGFADHEALAFVWLFAALWTFVKAWKSKNNIYSVLSGLFTGLMVLSWGGYKFLVIIISIFFLCTLIFRNNKLSLDKIKLYYIWYFITSIFIFIKYSYKKYVFLVQYEFLIISFVAVVLLFNFLMNKYNKKQPLLNKGIVSTIIVAVTGLIIGTITKTFTLHGIFNKIIHPTGANRLALTVSENARTSLTMLFYNMSFVLPLALCGVALLIYAIYNKKTNSATIFSLCFFGITAMFAMGSARTVIMFAPAVALLAGFCIYKGVSFLLENDKKAYAVLLIIFAVFAFAYCFNQSQVTNASSGSNYPGQWEDTMTWIKNNTHEASVFAHWWDYGYWTQVMGERTSVVDGGNAKGWDHGMGRYGLLGRDPNNYLSYFKTHMVNYLLISGEDIPKFHAFSTVGSDENFDLKSNIGMFGLHNNKEIRNGTRKTYGGYWKLDKDYIWNNMVFSESDIIVGIVLDDNNGVISNANIILSKNNLPYEIPITTLCVEQRCIPMSETGFPGTVTLIPNIMDEVNVDPIGGALFTSEKIDDTLFVKLFITQEPMPYFKLVYQTNLPLAFYKGRLIAPNKIWELRYPYNIPMDEKYLEFSEHG